MLVVSLKGCLLGTLESLHSTYLQARSSDRASLFVRRLCEVAAQRRHGQRPLGQVWRAPATWSSPRCWLAVAPALPTPPPGRPGSTSCELRNPPRPHPAASAATPRRPPSARRC